MHAIRYNSYSVKVANGHKVLEGDMALCTVPLGEWFHQVHSGVSLAKLETIERLGFALLNKEALLFPHPSKNTSRSTSSSTKIRDKNANGVIDRALFSAQNDRCSEHRESRLMDWKQEQTYWLILIQIWILYSTRGGDDQGGTSQASLVDSKIGQPRKKKEQRQVGKDKFPSATQ